MEENQYVLPSILQIALAWQPVRFREALACRLRMDAAFARILGQHREPLLAQMRLLWWRDQLTGGGSADPLAATIIGQGHDACAAMEKVNLGWERLLLADVLSDDVVEDFANGRAWLFFDAEFGQNEQKAARFWAAWDLLRHLSDANERETVLQWLRKQPDNARLTTPKQRALAILSQLAKHDVARHNGAGDPLSRSGLLRIARIGMFGK